jgi:Asp/Glu/hydantoin racemase
MIKTIGFVHTNVPIANLFKQLIAEHLEGVRTFHIVDDSLIQDILQIGEMTPSILRRLSAQIVLAREAGADLIMCTCSSMSPGVDLARKLVDVTVLKIDDPMAEKAVQMGNTVGVLATAKSTFIPSTELIKSWAEQKGKSVRVEGVLCEEAFDFFFRGDMKAYDDLIKKEGLKLASKVDVLVLAQASMSHLANEIEVASGKPVLMSPKLAIETLKNLLK